MTITLEISPPDLPELEAAARSHRCSVTEYTALLLSQTAGAHRRNRLAAIGALRGKYAEFRDQGFSGDDVRRQREAEQEERFNAAPGKGN